MLSDITPGNNFSSRHELHLAAATNVCCSMDNKDSPMNSSTDTPQMVMDPYGIAQILLLGLLAVISVMGNTLVVTAVVKEQRLHTYTNYFIVSLACADLLVSVVVVPICIVYQVSQYLSNFIHTLRFLFTHSPRENYAG